MAPDASDDEPGIDAGAGPGDDLTESGDALAQAEAVLDADIVAIVTERDEIKAMAQRLQADFENFKKRAERERATTVERANERLLESLLPALDSFELAGVSIAGATDADVEVLEKLRKGVQLAIAQLDEAVANAGLERIDQTGVAFDPTEHEAVLQDDGDGDPAVESVLRTGYRLRGRVLRPAMVKVTRSGA